MRILIVEDDKHYAESLAKVLSGAGHDVEIFLVDFEMQKIDSIVSTALNQKDLVLLDHSFGGYFIWFTGQDVMRALSQHAKRPKVISISLSERDYADANFDSKHKVDANPNLVRKLLELVGK